MSAFVPLWLLLVLVHAALFLTSERPDRRDRLLQALVICALAWLLFIASFVLDSVPVLLKRLLRASLWVLPLLAFLVYLRRRP